MNLNGNESGKKEKDNAKEKKTVRMEYMKKGNK